MYKLFSQNPSDLCCGQQQHPAFSIFFDLVKLLSLTARTSAHLNFADISEDNSAMPSMVQVRTKASKNDSFRQGVNVHIGRTGNDLCPVITLLMYLAGRGNAPGLLFRFEDGSSLTKNRFVTKFHSALTYNLALTAHYIQDTLCRWILSCEF